MVLYNPRLKNKRGIEIAWLPQPLYLPPLYYFYTDEAKNISEELWSIVNITEGSQLVKFGRFKQDSGINPDILLDEMGIHPYSEKQKWFVSVSTEKDHFFDMKWIEYLRMDVEGRKEGYSGIIVWNEPEPGVLQNRDTTITFGEGEVSIDLPMGETYIDLVGRVCEEGEILIPTKSNDVPNKFRLEIAGIEVRVLDDSLTTGLDSKTKLNNLFYACKVPEDSERTTTSNKLIRKKYDVQTNPMGGSIEILFDTHEPDWKTTGVANQELTTFKISYFPEF